MSREANLWKNGSWVPPCFGRHCHPKPEGWNICILIDFVAVLVLPWDFDQALDLAYASLFWIYLEDSNQAHLNRH